MKKLFSIILVLAMALSLMCGSFVSAYADEEFEEEAVAAAPVAELEEPAMDGRTSVTELYLTVIDGSLSLTGGVDSDGADVDLTSIFLTDNGDGTYKLDGKDSGYSLSKASLVLDPALGTVSAMTGSSGTYTFTFTPAGEGGGETGGESGGETGGETSGATLAPGSWCISYGDRTFINGDDYDWEYDLNNPRAQIVASVAESAGFDLLAGDADTGSGYLAVVDGKMVVGERNGSWEVKDNHLVFSNGSETLYLAGWKDTGFAMSADPAAAIEIKLEPYGGEGSSSGGESGGSSSSSSTVTFNKTEVNFDKNYMAFVVDGYTAYVKKGPYAVGAASGGIVVNGETAEVTSGYAWSVENADFGFNFYIYDKGPGTYEYMTIDTESGIVSSVSAAPEGVWNYVGGHLTFTWAADGSVWYMGGYADGNFTATQDSAEAAEVAVFASDTAPASSGGGGGGGSTETVDASAPVVSAQPASVHFVIEGSGFEAPTFSATFALPEGSTAEGITTQWFVEGAAVGEPEFIAGAEASTSITVDAFAGKEVGVYPVYCKATCAVDGVEHSVSTYTVNFIVCKGVLENSLITYSDVHQTWDAIGTAIGDVMKANNGLVPSLVISTGDWNNGQLAGQKDEYIKKCMEEIIGRLALQIGQIDTVWVSGNHDNGYAADYTNWNEGIALGIKLDDYYNYDGKISGTGIIFDTRSEDFKANADSSAAEDGLIVIGVNYEDMQVSGIDYGNGAEETDSVYKHLKTALDDVAADYNGEVVVISTHAGIHVLGVDPASTSDDWGGGDKYNVTNSAAIVKLINGYVDQYGMRILFLFGHDHSKGESEFLKQPGDTVISTVDYSTKTYEEIELKFTYAHSGYIGSGAAGNVQTYYSFITWDSENVTRNVGKVKDGSGLANENDLGFVIPRTVSIGPKTYDYKVDFSDVKIDGSEISGTGKIVKDDGSVSEGKQYVYIVINYQRDDGTTWAIAGSYPVDDGVFDFPAISSVADDIESVFVIGLDYKVEGAAWAGHNITAPTPVVAA